MRNDEKDQLTRACWWWLSPSSIQIANSNTSSSQHVASVARVFCLGSIFSWSVVGSSLDRAPRRSTVHAWRHVSVCMWVCVCVCVCVWVCMQTLVGQGGKQQLITSVCKHAPSFSTLRDVKHIKPLQTKLAVGPHGETLSVAIDSPHLNWSCCEH